MPQGRSGLVRKILPSPGLDTRALQTVPSRYIDCSFTGTPAEYPYRLAKGNVLSLCVTRRMGLMFECWQV
jgi:hypothetical protein